MQGELPDVKGHSERNLRYMYDFYCLYSEIIGILQQPAANLPHLVAELKIEKLPQGVADSSQANWQQDAADLLLSNVCSIPWFHQRTIIDKCKGNPDKAIFFVRKVLENNWGRGVLLNFLDTNLYERQGKAITNSEYELSKIYPTYFKSSMPSIREIEDAVSKVSGSSGLS